MSFFRSRLSVLIAVFAVLLVAVPATFAQDDFDILDLVSSGPLPSSGPTFGSVWLSAGFMPDPYEVNVTSGGDISAYGWLGSACSGYVAVNADFELNWSGVGDELYIGFESFEGDTTLVVRDPYGQYWCSDDVFGLDPEVGFYYPAAGTYQVWVGSYGSGDYHDGLLYITEL